MITKELLVASSTCNSDMADKWVNALDDAATKYDVTNDKRVAMFIAQLGHESGGFAFTAENLNYSAAGLMSVFGKYFPNLQVANAYARQPEKIANRIYASRMGNGPEETGDGYRYCGRGLIQVTGKENYTWFAASVGITPEEASSYMQTFEGAAQSACWFWESNNLNHYADIDDFVTMTKKINGGTIGIEDRTARYERFLKIFGV